jgi:multidrug efflux pump subunit AcrA (membrane-fusion protein)
MKKETVFKVSAVPAILVVGILAMQTLGSAEKETNKREMTPEPRSVETELLAFSDMALMVEGNGVVESERNLDIVSEASGRVLFAKNDLKDGTYVSQGEVVLKIDSRDVENDLYALRSDFLNAVASVLPELQIDDGRIYRRWFDYFNSLDIKTPVPDLPEITNAQEKIKISTKDIIGKYYAVRNQEILLSKYTIRASFDGYISSTGVIENSFVSTGQHLFTLADPKNLVVTVPLIVEDSRSIDCSPAPMVTGYADEGSEDMKTGRIFRKETMVDRNSQTLNVYVNFTNNDLDPNFLPGSYVHVSIEGRMLRNVAPLARNLLDHEGYVFTMRDGSLDRQHFEVVAYQGDLALVRNTVPDEAVIVTTVLQRPLIGMSIRSINMPELQGDESELAEQGGGVEPVAAGG